MVTYFPDKRVMERLVAIRDEVDRMIVVDNGSQEEMRNELEKWALANDATFLMNACNRGLAAALNQGLAWSESHGCEWAVTFDQDSTPRHGFVAAAFATAQAAAVPEKVAMVGANTFDERTGRKDCWLQPAWLGFRRTFCTDEDLSRVTFVITSGTLTNVEAWRALGGFDEGLFIDYLDHDLCLKAHHAGRGILVSARAQLAHNLGSKREVATIVRKLHPTFHSASRHYYMARNRILMWRRHAWRFPHWWLFDVCFGALNFFRVMAVEDRRREKAIAALCGTWHGLLGRRGSLEDVR